jgi:hypothetical protein
MTGLTSTGSTPGGPALSSRFCEAIVASMFFSRAASSWAVAGSVKLKVMPLSPVSGDDG